MKPARMLTLFLVGMLMATMVHVAPAALDEDSDGSLRIEIVTAYNFIVDSNVESPSTYAPRAATIAAKFHNDGTTTISNVFAYAGDYANGTPAIYPSRPHLNLAGFLTGTNEVTGLLYDARGEFALTHEGGRIGASDATRYLGSIPPGEYRAVYWLVSYPNLDANGDAVWGPSIKPDDDLYLTYDIWGEAVEAGTDREVKLSRKVTMRNEISAMANKIQPNGANKVPQYYQELLDKYAPEWVSLDEDGTPGTRIVAQGFWYDLGNIGHGFDNDTNGVPDKNAWMQPIGDASTFDAGSFRLMKTEAMVVVKLKTGGEQVYFETDKLYFENNPENNGAVGLVYYFFMPLAGPVDTLLSPYQEVASGFDNEKFNGDYGATLSLLSSKESTVFVDKNVDKTYIEVGGTLSYSADFYNQGTLLIGDPDLGLPVVLSDEIPDGTTYIAGSAVASNTLPSNITSYAVLYSTNSGVSWQSTEPSPASAVTDIQWWLSDGLPPDSTGTVTLAVTVDDPYVEPDPIICNTAAVGIANGPPLDEDKVCSLVLGSNTVGDTVFYDTGVAGYFGNGIQNIDESGISNVTVWLYYDANSNGVADTGEPLIFTQSTDTNGNYLFTGLPDGMFVVKVDGTDPDIPTGYTVTTPEYFSVNLDAAGVEPNPVSYLDADFGFAPALVLDKTLTSSSPLYEGQQATYTIDVRNRLPGTGTGEAGPITVTYDGWARTLVDYDAVDVTNPTNTVLPPGPDGNYTAMKFANNSDGYRVTEWGFGTQAGTVTAVSVIVQLGAIDPYRADDQLQIYVYPTGLDGNNDEIFYTALLVSSLTAYAELEIDVSSALSPWQWSDLSSNQYDVTVNAQKGGGALNNSIYIDSVGLRVDGVVTGLPATAATTLQPVPLHDHYDTNKLEFVSASPAETTASNNGSTGTLYWADIGPIYPGGTSSVSLVFNVLEPPSNTNNVITNTAFTLNAEFQNGWESNDDTDTVVTVVLPTGTIGDFVWRDLNQDGVQDGPASNETGIANVSVRLTPPTGVDAGNGPGVAVTNVTDASGYYLFTGLPTSGVYTVTVLTDTLPTGTFSYTNTYDEDNGIVGGGDGDPNDESTWDLDHDATDGSDTHLTTDFGYLLPSAIDGLIWHDLNRSSNAVVDTGEPWLTNVTVYLVDSTGTTIATNQTDANGYFIFIGSYSGTYTVLVDTTTGPLGTGTWDQTFDTDGLGTLDSATATVVLGGGAHVDYSYVQTGPYDIGDTLFYDWDGDAVQDAIDEGIPDVTVQLYYDGNGNGVLDIGSDVLITTDVTDADGKYLFPDYPPGDYLVVVDTTDTNYPTGMTQTLDPDETGVATNADDRGIVIVVDTNRLDIDFAYKPSGDGTIGDTVWRDMNADQVQAGPLETGITGITVTLYADLNGDSTYVAVATQVTDSVGEYLFTNLPDGAYRVDVATNDPDLPMDSFGNPWVATTPTSDFTTILNGNNYLDADFGFVALGAIGDTIFWDANVNGTQDFTEGGISNVTVWLFYDTNTNDLYDAGDVLVGTQITDTNGFYLFDQLVASNYIVVVDTNSAVLTNAGAYLTADPDADGVAAPDLPATNTVGRDAQTDVTILVGQNFMGADFGFAPPGVLGDTVWIDVDANGVRDTGELGIPYITVELRTGGVVVATTQTDPDGWYYFYNLMDDIYSVTVVTNDTNFPDGLTMTYDPDGVLDSAATNVVMSNGVVVVIGTNSYTNASFDVDFGYRRSGTNWLSGTVGLDGSPTNGVMGTTDSGYDSDEAPFTGHSVYLYFWTDANSNNVVEGGETELLLSTTTATNGDYRFDGLPDGASNEYYLVRLAAPASGLKLTTTTGVTPGLTVNQTTNASGENVTAEQVIRIVPVTTNIDFAYITALNYDYGDLPQTYSTRIEDTPFGARHVVPPSTNLYLGATVDYEANGQPSIDATGDGADEDGADKIGTWTNGVDGGRVYAKIGSGTGWLVAWVDFDQSGDFTGSGEMIANQAVSSTGGPGADGAYTFTFDVPAGTMSTTTNTLLNARFRLTATEPAFPQVSFSGGSANGEVEDYQFDFPITTLALLKSFRALAQNGVALVQWETAVEEGTVGFYLERLVGGKYVRINPYLIPSETFGGGGAVYEQLDTGAFEGGTYTYRLIEVEQNGNRRLLGPYTVTVGGPGLTLFEWSRAMFTPEQLDDPSVSAGTADPDGDGHSNFEEYLSGTIPTDIASVLKVIAVRGQGDTTVVTWLSKAGRVYAVEVSTNLLDGFSAAGTDIVATPPANTYTDTVERVDGASYRIKLTHPSE